MREEEVAAKSRNIQVKVKSSGDISAEPAEDKKSKNILLQTYMYVTMRTDLV